MSHRINGISIHRRNRIMQDPMGRYYNIFLGCIAGGAAGDALGFPVEYLRLSEIVAHYGRQGVTSFEPGPNGKALISDDTQMTLFTMDGLTTAMRRVQQHRTDSPAEVYIDRAYLDWYATQHPRMPYSRAFTSIYSDPRLHTQRAPGRTSLSALKEQFRNPRNPRDEFDVGRRGTIEKPLNDSKTCGALMRSAPIGLMLNTDNYNLQADSVAKVAARCAAITHGHPISWLSAAFFAELINRMMYRRPADPTLERIVVNSLYQVETQFLETPYLEEFSRQIEKAMQLAADGTLSIGACMKELGDGLNADSAIANAVYLLLHYQYDYPRAIHAAINRTGDSDTIGSVTGNLIGAWLGFEEIARQMDYLHKTEEYIQQNLEMYDLILDTVQRAYRISILGT